MPKRRNVLIGLGGMVTLSGCMGGSSEDPDPEPARFEIANMVQSGYTNHHPQNHNDFTVQIKNTGDVEDTQRVGFEIEGITEEEEIVTLGGGRSTEVSFSGNYREGEDKTYQYSYHTEEDDEIGGEVFIFECPLSRDLPDYRPLGADDLGTGNIERANIDVRLLNDGDEYTDSELILIAKDVVCDFSTEYDWHAISTTYWERGDNPGFTEAYAECNWAPNGRWSEARNSELGNYSEHDYSLRRI